NELTALVDTLPEPERYSYDFEGNSQVLDHILVSAGLSQRAQLDYDIVHVNSEFNPQQSDHDPQVVRIRFFAPPTPTPSATPTPNPSPGQTATPSPTPSGTPGPTPTPSPTPVPTSIPSPLPTVTPKPLPTPAPTPGPTPTAAPTPTPKPTPF